MEYTRITVECMDGTVAVWTTESVEETDSVLESVETILGSPDQISL